MDSLIHKVEGLLRDVAEQEILTRFQNLQETDIQHKDDHGHDLVTTADLEAENRLREGLLKLLPGSHVIGEEAAFKSPDILQDLHSDKPVWVVDPVDGTRNFATGKPCFAVIVALVIKGKTQMGWILDPISDACITARLGCGAYLGTQKLTLNFPSVDISDMTGSVGKHVQDRLIKQKTSHQLGHMVRYHCVGREYMDLALGKIQYAMYGGKMMPWDHAAGVLIVEECGGFVRSIEEKNRYSAARQGPDQRILITPTETAFESLKPLLTNKI